LDFQALGYKESIWIVEVRALEVLDQEQIERYVMHEVGRGLKLNPNVSFSSPTTTIFQSVDNLPVHDSTYEEL
jgi:hypothetical protein